MVQGLLVRVQSILVFLSLLLGYGSVFANPLSPLKPRLLEAETYAENWHVMVDAGDKGYYAIHFIISNVGIGDGHGVCRLLWIPRKGPMVAGGVNVSRAEWRFAKTEKGALLAIDKCVLKQEDGHVFAKAVVDGNQLTVRAKNTKIKKLRVPDSLLAHGDKFFEYVPMVLRAKATVTFKPVKGTARSYEGFLHLDHSRSTTMPRDIAAGWLRLLVLSGDAHWGLKLRLLDDNASAVGWLWDFKNGSATPIYDAKVDVMGEAGNFSEIWVNGKGLVGRLHITRDKHLFRDAPVEAYGILGLMVKPWVGNPVTNIFRVNWKRGDKSVGTGIMALAEH